MSFGVVTTLEITGDQHLFERCSERLRKPRTLMRRIGVLGMSSGVRRLEGVLSQSDSAIRTGRLGASIRVDDKGSGNADTIFELGEHSVTVGSNLPYAAQVQYGGIIEPKTAKALAIPLTPALKRAQLSPSDIDPNRELLRFQPYTGSKPNIFGLLIDDGQELTGRQRKKRGGTQYGPGPLFALAWWVSQRPRPFLFWADEDQRVINEELVPQWLELE